jgi:DNA-3-methyladenine glycosylase II
MAKKAHHPTLLTNEARHEATRYISRRDPLLRDVIKKIGTMAFVPQERRSPFESLARAIAHQQLHGAAAKTILGRFAALFPGRRFPRAADLEKVKDQQIRAAGFSGSKVAALRDLAEKTIQGVVPTSRELLQLHDDEIVERLTEVRGIGRWTVEMLLIFQLGRADVLPVDDFGVRNGFRKLNNHPELHKPKVLLELGETWRPYRTVAAWYLWRAVELFPER